MPHKFATGSMTTSQILCSAFFLRQIADGVTVHGSVRAQEVDAPVHLGPITHHDAVECVGQRIIDRRRLARGAHREDRKYPSDERPQPSLAPGGIAVR